MSNLTEVRRGILWMIGASIFLVNADAVAKLLTPIYPAMEILWIRYVVQTAFLSVLFARDIRSVLSSKRIAMHAVRGALLVLQIGAFYTGLRYVPLADATAILFVAPLFVVALSAPLLGERVPRSHWLAVLLGFLGAMIVIRPGFAAFQLASLFPLAAAILFAFYQIMTRVLGRTEPPRTTLFFTFLTGTILTSALAPFSWVPPVGTDWILLVATGLFSGLGQFFLIKAFTAAPAAIISPFSYITLLWAAALGQILFGQFPDLWTVVGAILIVAGGLYIFRTVDSTGRAGTPQ